MRWFRLTSIPVAIAGSQQERASRLERHEGPKTGRREGRAVSKV